MIAALVQKGKSVVAAEITSADRNLAFPRLVAVSETPAARYQTGAEPYSHVRPAPHRKAAEAAGSKTNVDAHRRVAQPKTRTVEPLETTVAALSIAEPAVCRRPAEGAEQATSVDALRQRATSWEQSAVWCPRAAAATWTAGGALSQKPVAEGDRATGAAASRAPVTR